MIERRLLISFSGGETSGFMTWLMLNRFRNDYDKIVVVFANTGEENEETLEFVKQCDEHFMFGTVWIEADVHQEVGVGVTAKIVDFATCSRSGGPFEDVIKTYGIPNQAFKHCTKSLKTAPIASYARSIGWRAGSYDTAIGIRADEIDRMSVNRVKNRIRYPLIELLIVTKIEVNTWWSKQPFRLRLKGYQGNCKWCWKKSDRKHLTILGEHPEFYDFPQRMESLYGTVGHEFSDERKEKDGLLPEEYKRTFFRNNRSVEDLRKLYNAKKGRFRPAADDAQQNSLFDPEFDLGGGCEETCEVHADEDDAP